MSIFDGISSFNPRRKLERTRSMRKDMDGKVFFSRQSRLFYFVKKIKVRFPTLYYDLACTQSCFPPKEAKIGETKVLKLVKFHCTI